jgi:NAD(P)-dependent dehydrogenase (short-subunit alcohol dehydrogenase family)
MRLSGKVAMITGAARGLGRACALRFAEEGADLVLLDIAHDLVEVPYNLGTENQLDYTSELCRCSGAAVETACVDIRDLSAIDEATRLATERFGRIDALVNSAGVAAPSGKIVHDIEEPEWKLMIDIDLSGAWRVMKSVGKLMTAQRSGSIINIASTAGVVGYRNFAGYVAAKHGLVGLTRAAALDYAPLKVRVNALLPGSVRDDEGMEGKMLAEIARSLSVPAAEYESTFLRAQPMNVLTEPSDVAHAAVWLASDESVRVTGSAITIDCGFTAR